VSSYFCRQKKKLKTREEKRRPRYGSFGGDRWLGGSSPEKKLMVDKEKGE